MKRWIAIALIIAIFGIARCLEYYSASHTPNPKTEGRKETYAVINLCPNCYENVNVAIPRGISQKQYVGTKVVCPNCGVALVFSEDTLILYSRDSGIKVRVVPAAKETK